MGVCVGGCGLFRSGEMNKKIISHFTIVYFPKTSIDSNDHTITIMDIQAKFTPPPGFTERRMPSLYSDFRTIKESNTEGYDANVATWKSVLQEALSSGTVFPDAVLLTAGSSLLESFASARFGRPLALDCVFVSVFN